MHDLLRSNDVVYFIQEDSSFLRNKLFALDPRLREDDMVEIRGLLLKTFGVKNYEFI